MEVENHLFVEEHHHPSHALHDCFRECIAKKHSSINEFSEQSVTGVRGYCCHPRSAVPRKTLRPNTSATSSSL